MWLRLAGALLVTLAAIGALEYFGVSRLLGGRSPDEAPAAAGKSRELFWLAIFFVVMATSLLAAARRVAGRLRQAVRTRTGRGPLG
jgi:hypothetical protein